MIEFEYVTSTRARMRLMIPSSISASTSPLTFSTPLSVTTCGVIPIPAAASRRIATVVLGSSFSQSRHARIRREKLSMTPCKNTLVPSSRRMTVTSRCQYSLGCDARMPTLGLAG